MAFTVAPPPTASADRVHPTVPPAEPIDPAEKSQYPGFGSDGFTFADLLDIINPLQHIPIISTLYRSITGDELGAIPRMLGGALFGGPIGLAASAASAVIEGATGKDPGEHILALFDGDEGKPASEVLLAEAQSDGGALQALPAAGAVDAVRSSAAPAHAKMSPPAYPIHLATMSTPPAALPAPGRVTALPVGGIVRGGLIDMPPLPQTMTRLQTLRTIPGDTEDEKDDRRRAHRQKPPNVPEWFPETMLNALDKYREGARLNRHSAPQIQLDR